LSQISCQVIRLVLILSSLVFLLYLRCFVVRYLPMHCYRQLICYLQTLFLKSSTIRQIDVVVLRSKVKQLDCSDVKFILCSSSTPWINLPFNFSINSIRSLFNSKVFLFFPITHWFFQVRASIDLSDQITRIYHFGPMMN
jgi:hypothetical protein